MGDEARAVMAAKADQVGAISADLRTRADAFEQSDHEFHAALAGITWLS